MPEEIKELSRIKRLISSGYKRFINRKDRDYISELLDIGITEEMAWREIITLSSKNYKIDYKPNYRKGIKNALIFKKIVNGYMVYIKVKIEEYNKVEYAVCLSFHIDNR